MKRIIFSTLLFCSQIFTKCTMFSSDGKYLVITQNNIAKIFCVKTIEPLIRINFKNAHPDFKCDHDSEILSIGISPDNKYLVTTGNEGSKMWSLERGRLLIKL